MAILHHPQHRIADHDLGLILAAQTVPFVLLLLFGGVWADRLPRHRVMIASDIVRASVHALLAVLILTGSAQVWEIAAIEAVFGVAWAFFQPAETGLMPQTVTEDEIQSARAWMEGSWNLSLVLGPAVATALVLTVGAGWAFAADALTFVVSALTLLAPMRPRMRAAAPAAILVRVSFIGELARRLPRGVVAPVGVGHDRRLQRDADDLVCNVDVARAGRNP